MAIVDWRRRLLQLTSPSRAEDRAGLANTPAIGRMWASTAAMHARLTTGIRAEIDRSMITARMTAGRRRKKADGGKGEGSYPFGFTKNGPHPDEQATLARITSLIDRNGVTLADAATILNSENRLTRSGRPWSRQNLWKVRRNALRF